MDAAALHTINWALRGALIGLLLFCSALALREAATSIRARLEAAVAFGSAAYVLYFAPGFFTVPLPWWKAIVASISAGNIAVFWLFSRALFDDDFRWRTWHVLPCALLAALPLLICFVLAPARSPWVEVVSAGIGVASVVFAALAVGQSIATWHADLVEGRRRVRMFLVGGGAVYAALVTFARFGTLPGAGSEWNNLLDAAGLAFIVVVVLWNRFQLKRWTLPEPEAVPSPLPIAESEQAPEDPPPDPADDRWIAAILSQMTVERAYKRESLTIGALARQLGLQEYKLRRLINQRLGYRNFNAFLNHYRITDAKRRLADPAQADVPVLTIAIDVGFQSLGPFNRAFKSDTGVTPSEFRRGGAAAPAASLAMIR